MTGENEKILQQIKGGLIVSCQALEHEPLYGSDTMAKMAVAAYRGGAVGIRANTVCDIRAIRAAVPVPIIGIIKREYADSEVYITPTLREVEELCALGVEILALDATARKRPGGLTLSQLVCEIKHRFPGQLLMADTSCFSEGVEAQRLGFDLVATTMAGYTPYTKGRPLPDLHLLEQYASSLDVPVIAEGGIHYPGQLQQALAAGAHAAVVGGAITRPLEITQRFVQAIKRP